MLPEAQKRRCRKAQATTIPRPTRGKISATTFAASPAALPGSIFPVIYGNGQQIVQAPGFVTILQEMVHEARVIPLDGRPHAGPEHPLLYGRPARSLGRQHARCGDHQFPRQQDRHGGNGGGTPHKRRLKLTERFTRVGPND